MHKKPVAVVTGGAQGIGKGITKHFLENHISVIMADTDKTAGAQTEKEFAPFGDVIYQHANIAREKDVKQVVQTAKKNFGRLDYLINNAGIMIRKSITALTLAEWNKLIGINLTGAFLCAKYAAPLLKSANGSIVNIASTRAFMSEPNTESYAASKGGLYALTHALSISLGPEVRVNCISPGWIEVSDWKKPSKRHKPHLSAADKNQHPVGRVGNPEDIASLAYFLVSEQSGFITGANFIVDGGMTRKMIYVGD